MNNLDIGGFIRTSYSAREGIVTSIVRRPASDYVTDGIVVKAFLVEFAPLDENGVPDFDFAGYTTVFRDSKKDWMGLVDGSDCWKGI